MTMSQFTFPQRRAIIKGLLNASNPTKQELGRRFAYFLGFTPGPRGPDDGIDGLIEEKMKEVVAVNERPTPYEMNLYFNL